MHRRSYISTDETVAAGTVERAIEQMERDKGDAEFSAMTLRSSVSSCGVDPDGVAEVAEADGYAAGFGDALERLKDTLRYDGYDVW